MSEIPADKAHGGARPRMSEAVHLCGNNSSSAHIYDHKRYDTGTQGSEQSVTARQHEVRSKHQHSPLAGKSSNKGSRAFQPHLDRQEGVATGTLPVARQQYQHQHHHHHQQQLLHHQQHQHIVHCQFHRPCIANLQHAAVGVGGIPFTHHPHPLHQQQTAYPGWDSRCVATPNLDVIGAFPQQPQPLIVPPALPPVPPLKAAGRSFLRTGKHSLLNRNGLVAIPESSQVSNCSSTSGTSGWDSSPSDWQEESQLLVQDSSILDYRLGKPFLGNSKPPKNGHRKSLSQLNRTPKRGLLSTIGDLKINKITLLKKKAEPGPKPSSDCDPLAAAKGSGAQSPRSGSIPSLSASESELFSGADYTLVGSQDIDSWLDSNPDFWEEIREPPLEEPGELSEENPGKSKRKKISNCEEKRDKEKEGRIAKRICDSLLNSGSYCSEDLPQAETEPEPRTQRSRRIRNSSRKRSNIESEGDERHHKSFDTIRVERDTDTGTRKKKTHRLIFQWTDFDIDASLEFITGVIDLESNTCVKRDSTMVAKSQESSDSEGQFHFQNLNFFLLCVIILFIQHTASSNTLSW